VPAWVVFIVDNTRIRVRVLLSPSSNDPESVAVKERFNISPFTLPPIVAAPTEYSMINKFSMF
jgi:hypothetical protein